MPYYSFIDLYRICAGRLVRIPEVASLRYPLAVPVHRFDEFIIHIRILFPVFPVHLLKLIDHQINQSLHFLRYEDLVPCGEIVSRCLLKILKQSASSESDLRMEICAACFLDLFCLQLLILAALPTPIFAIACLYQYCFINYILFSLCMFVHF